MRVAIVSTSVNAAPVAYMHWARQGDLIVAGDANSPPSLERHVRDVGGRYLTPDMQRGWDFSDDVGWNCIQRRNAAIMDAYALKYDYVVTVDDDNIPTLNWVAEHVSHLNGQLPPDTATAVGDNCWVDIGQFNTPPTRQRGTPIDAVQFHSVVGAGELDTPLVVSTAQVLGDPDCDAITRIAFNPTVTGVARNVVPSVHQYAAFNSQATVWSGRWAPLMAVLPHVGRYDDIVASLIAKRIMRSHRVSLYAGEPCVTQDRNQHDAAADLRAEVWGMENVRRITQCLDNVILEQSHDLDDAYLECTNALDHVLPWSTIRFMRSWRRVWTANRW